MGFGFQALRSKKRAFTYLTQLTQGHFRFVALNSCAAFSSGGPFGGGGSTIGVSGWNELIPPAYEGGTDRVFMGRIGLDIRTR